LKFTVEYPISAHDLDPALISRDGMTQVVRTAEQCGFDAIAFTEHPAPSVKWLEAGGHGSIDGPAALAFCAAASARITLMTYLLVLPYHNPLMLAKALTTVDLLSGGRLAVVAGTGYLRSEFRALGVDMTERNELFDESIEVMRGVWAREPFDYPGRHFVAAGVGQRPGPARPGGPPILIGGNSAAARRRAARLQGWSPLLVGEQMAATTRTRPLDSIRELARRIAEVRDMAARAQGRRSAIQIQVHTSAARFPADGGSAEEHRDHLGTLEEIGVDRFILQPPGRSVGVLVDALQRYAATFGLDPEPFPSAPNRSPTRLISLFVLLYRRRGSAPAGPREIR
jgi:probable F420-dependent oxidoreductase